MWGRVRYNENDVAAAFFISFVSVRALIARTHPSWVHTWVPDKAGRLSNDFKDHIGSLLRDHQHAGVDMRRDQIRHDRSVDHAQALDSVNAQLRVSDRIGSDPHGAGAAGMVRRDRG